MAHPSPFKTQMRQLKKAPPGIPALVKAAMDWYDTMEDGGLPPAAENFMEAVEKYRKANKMKLH